jgi:hypothetical protein
VPLLQHHSRFENELHPLKNRNMWPLSRHDVTGFSSLDSRWIRGIYEKAAGIRQECFNSDPECFDLNEVMRLRISNRT